MTEVNPERPKLLLVEDEAYVLESLRRLLELEGFDCLCAADAAEAHPILRTGEAQVLVTDLSMPGEDGIALMKRAHELNPGLPVIVLTGVGTVQAAVTAMKEGALDFLVKPVDPEALVTLLRKAISHSELVDEVRSLRAAVRELADAPAIVGDSAAIRAVLTTVKSVAQTDVRVLIAGESGTGKELIAHAIHAASRRARKPFVRVNCAAIPDTLFESEFFGHRRGSFTGAIGDRTGRFAEAHGGTIALDEVGTLTLEAQAKLLRVIETGEYQPIGESKVRTTDARLIAITNEDLEARVKQKTFREDLYYRLKVVPMIVPPLRARKEDIPALAAHLLENLARRDGTPVKTVDPAAIEVLTRYDWPGNVRELRNTLERAALLEADAAISADAVAGILEGGMAFPAASLVVKGNEESLRIRERASALEKQLILEALRRARGKKGEACALLGIDASNFAYYVKKHQLALDGPVKGEPEA